MELTKRQKNLIWLALRKMKVRIVNDEERKEFDEIIELMEV